eukprot:SAG11_NODE_14743_length_601_cov_0.842629_1_plen_117_part_10
MRGGGGSGENAWVRQKKGTPAPHSVVRSFAESLADGKLEHHEWNAHHEEEEEIRDQERATAIRCAFVREPAHVAKADRIAQATEQKFHAGTPFFTWRILLSSVIRWRHRLLHDCIDA